MNKIDKFDTKNINRNETKSKTDWLRNVYNKLPLNEIFVALLRDYLLGYNGRTNCVARCDQKLECDLAGTKRETSTEQIVFLC